MPQAPALIGNLVASALGRHAQVRDLRRPAPGFLELDLDADAPPGGWHPGHELQFRVAPTLARRYTVRTVDTGDGHIGILAATEAAGPGTALLRRLRPGDRLTVLAGRHRPLSATGTRRLHLGDGCALGTIDAHARESEDPIVAVELPPDAIPPLTDRWPHYHLLPATQVPGAALHSWLERAIAANKLTNLDGALLLGHARSIQHQRRVLIDNQVLTRRAITTKPYWADGREGL